MKESEEQMLLCGAGREWEVEVGGGGEDEQLRREEIQEGERGEVNEGKWKWGVRRVKRKLINLESVRGMYRIRERQIANTKYFLIFGP